MSTLSQTSSPSIFLPFTHPFLTRNLKADLQLLHSQKWKSEIQIFSFRSRGTLFCKETLWFEELVQWRRHHQDVWVPSWQHFPGLPRKGFPSDNRHFHGHKLCLPPRHISVLIWSGIHTALAFDRKETVGISVQLHISIYRWRIVHW